MWLEFATMNCARRRYRVRLASQSMYFAEFEPRRLLASGLSSFDGLAHIDESSAELPVEQTLVVQAPDRTPGPIGIGSSFALSLSSASANPRVTDFPLSGAPPDANAQLENANNPDNQAPEENAALAGRSFEFAQIQTWRNESSDWLFGGSPIPAGSDFPSVGLGELNFRSWNLDTLERVIETGQPAAGSNTDVLKTVSLFPGDGIPDDPIPPIAGPHNAGSGPTYYVTTESSGTGDTDSPQQSNFYGRPMRTDMIDHVQIHVIIDGEESDAPSPTTSLNQTTTAELHPKERDRRIPTNVSRSDNVRELLWNQPDKNKGLGLAPQQSNSRAAMTKQIELHSLDQFFGSRARSATDLDKLQSLPSLSLEGKTSIAEHLELSPVQPSKPLPTFEIGTFPGSPTTQPPVGLELQQPEVIELLEDPGLDSSIGPFKAPTLSVDSSNDRESRFFWARTKATFAALAFALFYKLDRNTKSQRRPPDSTLLAPGRRKS